jgi:hypothetical protein
VKIRRAPYRLPITHSLDLQRLDKPLSLDLGDVPPGATKFQFDGEFAFFFKPYPGAWATEHFESCTVVRYSSKTMSHKRVMQKSLAGHYCNAAVGKGGFIVLSWWPYEDEAMRAIHEGAKSLRAVERTLEFTVKTSAKQQEEIARQQKALDAREAELEAQKQALDAADKARVQAERRAVQAERGAQATKKSADVLVANARYQAESAARAAQRERDARLQAEKRAVQAEDRVRFQAEKARIKEERNAQYLAEKARKDAQYQAERARAQAEREARRQAEAAWRNQRSERSRMRDPIHIYALSSGRAGDAEADWTLVGDYHKGAHALELGDAAESGGGGRVQRFRVTEHDKVFEFDLVATGELEALGSLPIVPRALCDGF